MRRRYTFILEMSIDSASDVNGRDDEGQIANILRDCEKDIKRGVWARKDRDPEAWIWAGWQLKEMEA